MKIGTHNCMSFMQPKHWWMYPFRFIAKCQSKTLKEQYNLGSRMFDVRIAFTKGGTPEFRHGSMAYKGDVLDTFRGLNSLGKNLKIRMILENTKYSRRLEEQEFYYRQLCWYLENIYPNLKFFCGRRKGDWKLIYQFKNQDPEIVQKISSMTWKIWDDWYPWLYAHFMNKKNRAEVDSKKWILVDFIEIK